jgi:hypothetical protein
MTKREFNEAITVIDARIARAKEHGHRQNVIQLEEQKRRLIIRWTGRPKDPQPELKGFE